MGRHGQAAWPLSSPRRLWLALLILPGALSAEPLLRQATEFETAARALDPVNFVMAQADLGKAAGLAPTDPPRAQQRSALMRLLFQDSSEQRPQLAPIRWRGNLSVEQRTTSSDFGRRTQWVEHAGVEMSTYIVQPWLAQVRANLGVLLQQQRESGQGLGGIAATGDRAASFTGGASLSVFPSSRFPFVATFDSSDSRTSGEATAADYVSRMLALRQSYRSPLGDQSYMGSLERSTLISDTSGTDVVTALNGTMQRTLGLHSVDVSGGYARNRRSTAASGSDVSRLAGRHSWRPTDLVTLDSYASFSMTDLGAGDSGSRSRFLQVNSFGSWRPDEESPFYVTGGVRAADAAVEAGGGELSARSVGANLAMSYALSPSAVLLASASVDHIGTANASRLVSTQTLGASYAPPPLTLGAFGYSWGVSTSLANQTGREEGRSLSGGAQADHRVSASTSVGPASFSASLNQAVALREDPPRGATTTLLHSGSLGVRLAPNPASDLFASVNLGDSRATGANADRFQMLNLQLSGQLQLGAFQNASANFTIQGVRQQLPGEETLRTTVQRSGSLSYQHTRLFGVPRLRLVIAATFNDLQLESRLLGDANAPVDQITRLLEQRLHYEIGRIDFRLGTRLATIDGRTDRQFFLRVNRQFGLY